MTAPFRERFDFARNPQEAAFALSLGQIYNVTQPAFAIGELIYSKSATELESLAPNTTTTKQYLSMTGTGTAGAAPAWDTLTSADIAGTATNDNAAAGYVGEYTEATLAAGSAVSLTTTVVSDVASISLTAGDWDVSAVVAYTFGATTNVTRLQGGISTTTATFDAAAGMQSFQWQFAAGEVPGAGANSRYHAGPHRLSLSGTTTVYLVARADFTVSTAVAWGAIRARRVR